MPWPFVTCLLIVAANCFILGAHAADWSCPEPTRQLAPNIAKEASENTKGVLNASDAALKTTVQDTFTNLWAAYPNADRIALAQNLESTSCNLVKSSSLGDEQKIAKWVQIVTVLLGSVRPDERSFLQLPPKFLNDMRLEETGIEYVRAVLGVPRSAVPGKAVFEKSGYVLTFGYFTDAARSGLINSILIEIDQRSTAVPGLIVFEGEWNNYCESRAGCREMIKPNARIGSPLKAFIAVHPCVFSYTQPSKDGPPLFFPEVPTFCRFPMHLEVTLYLDRGNDERTADLFSLRDRVDVVSSEKLSGEEISELEAKYDLPDNLWKQSTIYKMLAEELLGRPVVAFQVYLKAGNDQSYVLPYTYRGLNYK